MISIFGLQEYQCRRYILLSFLITLFSNNIMSQPNDDIAKVKTKLYNISVNAKYPEEYYTNLSIDTLIKNISKNGSWPDINYQDKTDSKWSLAEHWIRLLKLAVKYKNEKSKYYGNIQLRNAILNGIDLWLKETPKANN